MSTFDPNTPTREMVRQHIADAREHEREVERHILREVIFRETMARANQSEDDEGR